MTEGTVTETTATASRELPRTTTPDDLLAMYEAEAPAAPEPVEETPAAAEEPPAQELTSPPAPEKPEEPAPEGQTTKTPQEVDVKVLKGRMNGQDVEIPLAAEITQKVNGKEVTFKTSDAIQAYVKQEEFNRNMDRRISTVAQREQALTNEMQGVKSKAVEVVNAALKGDLLSSLRSLAKLAAGKSQLDVATFEKAYLDQIEKYSQAYTKMTPEQREKFFAERKASTYEEENKHLREVQQRRDAELNLLGKVSQLCEENGIDQKDFKATFEEMTKELVGEGKQFKTAHDISPDDVVNQINLTRHYQTAFDAAKKVGFKDDDPRLDGILDEVVTMTFGRPDITVETIQKILEGSGLVKSAPKTSVENLNRKAQKSGSSPQSAASSTKKANSSKGAYDDEELDFLHRHAPKKYVRVLR